MSRSSEAHSEIAQRMTGCHFDHFQLFMIQCKESGSSNREALACWDEIGLFAVDLPLSQLELDSCLGAPGKGGKDEELCSLSCGSGLDPSSSPMRGSYSLG